MSARLMESAAQGASLFTAGTATKILNSIPSGLFVYEYRPPDSLVLVGANPAAVELTGLSVGAHFGREFDDIWPEARQRGLTERYLEVMRTQTPYQTDQFSYEDQQVSGAYKIRAFPVSDELLGVAFEDVTNAWRAEERWRALFDHSPIGFVIWDNGQAPRCEAVNDHFAELTGLRSAAAVGRTVPQLLGETEFARRLREALGRVRDERAVIGFESAWNNVRGETKHVFAQCFSLSATRAAVSERGVVILDLTRRRKLETQLRHVHKLEAVGQLAGGVAHDFNNLIQAIQGYCDLALSGVGPQGRTAEYLQQVSAAATRATSLTRQLLLFSRRQEPERRTLDLNELLGDLSKMLGRLLGETTDLDLRPADEPVLIDADPGQIEQLIMNLCLNSRDAMLEGGRITITTRRAPSREPGESESAVLRIADTGSGIPIEIQDQIYEPFFTTKPAGQGTGLGLATVCAIVEKHSGTISLDNEPGRGTAFEITLPGARSAPEAAAESEPMPPPRGNGESILLAKDDDLVRSYCLRALRDAGYRPLEAADGEEAIRLATVHGDSIDLAILDVVLPRCDGPEVAESLLLPHPEVPVLFTSGHCPERIGPRFRTGLLEFITKPFEPHQLLRRIADLLSRKRAEVVKAEPAR